MTLRTIRHLLLGAFIVLIAATVVQSQQEKKVSGSKNANPQAAAKVDDKTAMQTATHTIVVYYFYQEPRCVTCKSFEQYTGEALQAEFASELKSGRLVWMPVDVKKDGNWHYVEDFQLSSKSVVVAVYISGKLEKANIVEWKNLDQIWQLVRTKPEFLKYIQNGTRVLLEKYPDKVKENPKSGDKKKKKKKK